MVFHDLTEAVDGTVLGPGDLAPGRLPRPRGTLSAFLVSALAGDVRAVDGPPVADDDALFGEDGALSLYCLYELHYRGFAGVADGWEWEPSLLALRRRLEQDLLARLDSLVAPAWPTAADVHRPEGVAGELRRLVGGGGGPSLSAHLAEHGSLDEFREFAVHRSLLQLKEADPHTWAIPRVAGEAKAALVTIQADEYGQGRQHAMHQNLFGLTLRALGLDPAYGAYLDRVPATTLATVNLPSLFGLHREHRAALLGHLAVFEMTSVGPMRAYSAALRRHGLPPAAREFFDVHVVADAEHELLAADTLAAGLVRAEPGLGAGLLFGARAAMAVEAEASKAVMNAWAGGKSALLP
jgi:hypothetical protein